MDESCTMDEAKSESLRQWLRKASRDLRAAHRLLADEPPLADVAAYHCQQAAEKALKAFLTLHDSPFPKTHLLGTLVTQCTQIEPEFGALHEAAETLTPFVTAFRYPGDVPDPAPEHVAEAVTQATTVLEMVSKHMPPEIVNR